MKFLILVFAIFLSTACVNHSEEISKEYNAKQHPFVFNAGILYLNQNKFTGTVCVIQDKDTLERQQYLYGKEHGLWQKFYKNGKLQEKRYYENGLKTGVMLGFWPNGRKKLYYEFTNGEYHGVCREWNHKGVLVKEMHYENGYEAGSQKLFYDNGKARANYVMKDGRRYGLLGTKNCVNTNDKIL